MKENLTQWKTTLVGLAVAILGLLQVFNFMNPEQSAAISAQIPLIGDKLGELLTLATGAFLIFGARDSKKKPPTKKIL